MTAPLILALDISKTNTGCAWGRAGETPRFLSLPGKDIDATDAMKKLGGWLIDWTKVNRPDWLFFEAGINPAAFMGDYDADKGRVRMTSNPQTTITLAKMIGVVEFVAGMKHIQTRTANVQTVRKAFLGKARPHNPKKHCRAMCDLLGWPAKNGDEADAAAVWYWTALQVAPRAAMIVTPMQQHKVASLMDPTMPGVEVRA